MKWDHLSYVIDQIKMADNKANFLLAFYGVLTGVLVRDFSNVWNTLQRYSSSNCLKCLLLIVLLVTCTLLIYLIIKFIYYFTKVVKPRVDPKKLLKDDNYESVIFWGDIAKKAEKFEYPDQDTIEKDLEKQIVANAVVASQKFYYVGEAYNLLPLTVIAYILLKVFLAILN